MNDKDKANPRTVEADATTVLLLPGWLNSDAAHWQSRWEVLHGHRRVEQDDWLWPRRGDWMARLDEVLLASPQGVLLVAHSLGRALAPHRPGRRCAAGRAARHRA